jgi:hypothetical protein
VSRCKLRALEHGAVELAGRVEDRQRELRRYVTGFDAFIAGADLQHDEVDYYCPACGYHDGILDVQYDYEPREKNSTPQRCGGNREIARCGAICPCCRLRIAGV